MNNYPYVFSHFTEIYFPYNKFSKIIYKGEFFMSEKNINCLAGLHVIMAKDKKPMSDSEKQKIVFTYNLSDLMQPHNMTKDDLSTPSGKWLRNYLIESYGSLTCMSTMLKIYRFKAVKKFLIDSCTLVRSQFGEDKIIMLYDDSLFHWSVDILSTELESMGCTNDVELCHIFNMK